MRTFSAFLTVIVLFFSADLLADKITKLKIEMLSGKTEIVENVDIDYTFYPYSSSGGAFYRPDHMQNGLRVMKGEGKIEVLWSKIANIEINRDTRYHVSDFINGKWEHYTFKTEAEAKKKSSSSSPTDKSYILNAEIQLLSGETEQVVLVKASREGLAGNTNLGKITLKLEDIKSITPVR